MISPNNLLRFHWDWVNSIHKLGRTNILILLRLSVHTCGISLHLFRYLISFIVSLLFSSYRSGFPNSSPGKESTCNTGDLGSIPGLGRCPGEGNDYPFQYSGLENSMNCIVHGVGRRESDTTEWLSRRTLFSLNFILTACERVVESNLSDVEGFNEIVTTDRIVQF